MTLITSMGMIVKDRVTCACGKSVKPERVLAGKTPHTPVTSSATKIHPEYGITQIIRL